MNTIGPQGDEDRPLITVFGGGKGGVGRSTLCAEAARSLARQGQRVLCIDASVHCPTLHALLQAQEPIYPVHTSLEQTDTHIAQFIHSTGHKNIWFHSLASSRRFPYVDHTLNAYELIEQLHDLDFDHILIDLPAELEPLSIGLFVLSDIPIIVCSPEPTAIRVTTQFIRAAIFQAFGFHPAMELYQDDMLDMLYQLPIDFDRRTLFECARLYGVNDLLMETLKHLEIYLIINLVREGSERDMGYVLSHAWHEELGVFPRFITPVDYEDRRWFYNRRTAGLTSIRGDEALSNDIEKLVRHLGNIDAFDQHYPRPVATAADAHPALCLGLSADTSPNQIRQHCRRLWEGYRRQTTVTLVFADPEKRNTMADKLELLYKRSLTLPGEPTPPPMPIDTTQELPAEEHDDTMPEAHGTIPLSPPQAPDTPTNYKHHDQAPGKLIEAMRLSRSLSLQDLSHRTHIGLKYLTAIEQTDLDVLPRPVYLRGYLREIARALGEDSDQLINEYFRLLDKLIAEST